MTGSSRRPTPTGRRRAVPRRFRDKNRPIENHLPAWWRKRRQRRRARLAAMTRGRRVARRLGIMATYLLALIAALVVASVIGFYTLSDVPQPTDLALPQTVTIQYSDGSTMARLGDQNRTVVPLSQVSVAARNAVLAAEDRNFYSEPAISLTGSARAVLNNLSGGSLQGGSGITQQYVKNAYLNSEQTLTRKLRELAISVKLSRNYSKDQILEWYLNTVYFGRGTYGIQAASYAYFGIPASKLTTAQGAVLAGLLRSPSYYDPAVNPGPSKDRWHYVLDGLVATGHLTAAQRATLPYPKVKPLSTEQQLGSSGPTSLLVQQVLAEAQADGVSRDDLFQRGMTIRTTIDPRAQQAALSAINSTFAHLTPAQRNMKNALVAVNPASGAVLAYYGGPNGKNYAGQPDYLDYASQGFRPPGSTFKPYVLATALSQNLANQGTTKYALNSVVNGSYQQTIDGTTIQNDPGDKDVSSSSVTLANALKYSLNTTFDQLALDVDPAAVAKLAHSAGIAETVDGTKTLANADGTTSFGIGIGDYPVRPIDQAVGYATFADGGVQHDAYFVTAITESNGATVFQHTLSQKRVMDSRVANDVTLAMEPIAGYSGVGLNRTSAAKTGTEGVAAANIAGNTNQGNSDAWMAGFTPQVSAAVWVGSGDSTHKIYNANGGAEYGSDLPGRTWQAFMNAYLAPLPVQPMATTQQITDATNTAPTAPPTTQAPTTTAPTTSAPPTTQAPTTQAPTSSSPPPSSSAPPTTSAPPSSSQPPTPTSSPTPQCGLLGCPTH